MDFEELKCLVAQDESENLEFKESTNSRALKEAGETLCGFLNNSGGSVLFGITPKKNIIGQEVSEKTKKEIAESVLKHFEPHAPIHVEYIDIGKGKWVISLHANVEKANPPYYFQNIPYHRMQSTKRIMPITMQHELLDERKLGVKSWESFPAVGVTVDDLDHQEIYNTVKDGISHQRIPPDTNPNEIKDILKRFDVYSDQVSNAAAVLFAKDPSYKYPQLLIRLARFRGRDKREFIDNQQVHGNAFKLLRAAENFWARHLPIASLFEEGKLQRIDEPFLPPLALRESIINAICHRDYTIHGSAINFAIYDDRVEIESYGQLPKKILLGDLKKKHKSIPRNPKIANVFYKRGMIEQWGRGTQQIVEQCLKAGHPEPDFIKDSSGITVCMYSKNPMKTRIDLISPDLMKSLQPRLIKILGILNSESLGISTNEVVDYVGKDLNKKTILRDLVTLEKRGLISRRGTGRGTLWIGLLSIEE